MTIGTTFHNQLTPSEWYIVELYRIGEVERLEF